MGYKTNTYCPFRISKVSFVPENDLSASELDIVVTSRDKECPKLRIYKITKDQVLKDYELELDSCITDVGWVQHNAMLTAQTNGTTKLYRVQDSYGNRLSELFQWEQEKSRISAVSVFSYASVAEGAFVRTTDSGVISLLSPSSTTPLRTYNDECSVRSCEALSTGHILAGNEFGQAKIYDPRSNQSDAVKILDLGGQPLSLLSIAQHPGRTHLILAGCSDGNLALWDVRDASVPLIMARHSGPVWDTKFHPFSFVAVTAGADSKIFSQTGSWEGDKIGDVKARDLSAENTLEPINSIALSGDYWAAGGDDACVVMGTFR